GAAPWRGRRRRSRCCAPARAETVRLVAVTLTLLVAGLTRVVAAEPPPTPYERQRLARGDVVYRVGAAPRDAVVVPDARGAIAFVRVPTGPEPIWAILTAPRRSPAIFPGLRSVEVLDGSPP